MTDWSNKTHHNKNFLGGRKMKSRFTALLMAGAMGVTCLAGCSGSGADSNKTADNQNQDTGEQTDAGKSGANTDSTERKENGDNGETYNVVMSWPNLTGI